MKKQIIKCMLIATTFGMIASMNTMAENNEADAGSGENAVNSSIIVDRADNVSIMSDNAMQAGINAVQMSIQVTPANEDDNIQKVEFRFADPDNINITDYRYHEDTGVLNIYAADPQPLFQQSNALSLGSVRALNDEGEEVDVQIEVSENSLSMSSNDEKVDVTSTYNNVKKELGEHYMDIFVTHPVDYMVTIPDSKDGIEPEDELVVKVDDVLLKFGQSLDISVTSENEWKLKDKDHPENPEAVSYQLGLGYEKLALNRKTEDILSVNNGRPCDNVVLTVLDVGEARTAGTFEDTLTFNVNLN